jgi:hypothetical protein
VKIVSAGLLFQGSDTISFEDWRVEVYDNLTSFKCILSELSSDVKDSELFFYVNSIFIDVVLLHELFESSTSFKMVRVGVELGDLSKSIILLSEFFESKDILLAEKKEHNFEANSVDPSVYETLTVYEKKVFDFFVENFRLKLGVLDWIEYSDSELVMLYDQIASFKLELI